MRNARPRAIALLVLASLLFVPPQAIAQTWTGAGQTSNWSDPANWDTNQVPQPGPTRVLTFDPPRATGPIVPISQDVANPYALNGIVFTARGRNTTLDGNPLTLTGAAPFLQNDAAPAESRVIRQSVNIDGPLTVRGNSPTTIVYGGVTLKNATGAGSATLEGGTLRFGRATYTGTTTVRDGILEIGGWSYAGGFAEFLVGSTSGQGDYFIGPRADVFAHPTLSGNGTIGLAPGGRINIENGGIIDPGNSALGPVASSLTIDGGLRFGEGGHYHVWAQNAPMATPDLVRFSDVLDVNGLLDLSGPGDVLDFNGYFVASGSVVVAEYEWRLGEFDVFNPAVTVAGATAAITYTSAAGDGPGQVIVTVTVPEPSVGLLAAISMGFVALKRRR